MQPLGHGALHLGPCSGSEDRARAAGFSVVIGAGDRDRTAALVATAAAQTDCLVSFGIAGGLAPELKAGHGDRIGRGCLRAMPLDGCATLSPAADRVRALDRGRLRSGIRGELHHRDNGRKEARPSHDPALWPLTLRARSSPAWRQPSVCPLSYCGRSPTLRAGTSRRRRWCR